MPKIFFILFLFFASNVHAQALEDYLHNSDKTFEWEEVGVSRLDGTSLHTLSLTSQTWRDIEWKHNLSLIVPNKLNNKHFCLLFIVGNTGMGDDKDFYLRIAKESGSAVAVLSSVPNQPLLDGKKEDELLAYTLRQYVDSGDKTWPIIFPMVKSGIKAMDALSEYSKKIDLNFESFVVSGSSKRGWTTYLVGANDTRVKGITPLVFDMLNMRAQVAWAEKVYGGQSEKIKDYSNMGLIEKIDQPRTVEVRKWVDPYEYRSKLTMPKLILLGTNDPYWVVDSQRHYFSELPGSKLIYQVANAGHHIRESEELFQTLKVWYQQLMQNEVIPEVKWAIKEEGKDFKKLEINSSVPIESIKLWQANSKIRDFRKAVWESETTNLSSAKQRMITLKAPKSGFRAFVGEIKLKLNSNKEMLVSTEAIVLDKLSEP